MQSRTETNIKEKGGRKGEGDRQTEIGRETERDSECSERNLQQLGPELFPELIKW